MLCYSGGSKNADKLTLKYGTDDGMIRTRRKFLVRGKG